MSFEEKNIHVTPCHLPFGDDGIDWAPVIEKIIAKPVPDIHSIGNEPKWGWSAGTTPLMKPTQENILIDGDILYFRYTCLERKVPSSIRNAHFDMRSRERRQQTGMHFLSSDEKKELKEDVKDMLQTDTPPSVISIEILHRIGTTTVYIGSNSANGVISVMDLLTTQVGFPAMYPLGGLERANVLTQGKATDTLRPMQFTQHLVDKTEPARDFMTWLWYATADGDGMFSVEGVGELVVAIGSPVKMELDKSEVAIKGITAAASKGAMCALQSGYKPLRYGISMACNKQLWEFTLDAGTLAYSSLKLPAENETDISEVFRERIGNIETLDKLFNSLYHSYLMQVDTEGNATKLENSVKEWITSADLDRYI